MERGARLVTWLKIIEPSISLSFILFHEEACSSILLVALFNQSKHWETQAHFSPEHADGTMFKKNTLGRLKSMLAM